MKIQIMTYSMKLGIDKMNYMFDGNNDLFVLFHTISTFRWGRPLFKRFQPDWERVGASMDDMEP